MSLTVWLEIIAGVVVFGGAEYFGQSALERIDAERHRND
jgi:hypothetical protein